VRSGRREFLRRGAGGLVLATTLASLAACANPAARGSGPFRMRSAREDRGYGPLRRAKDQDGREVLALPEGFSYVTFGRTGDPASDGTTTPRNHDGMTCFALPGGLVRLIRNHEVGNPAGNFANAVQGDPAARYDPLAGGGCMTLDFDPAGMRLVRDFVSLNGTLVNCAGGLAYHDAGWLSCEETLSGPPQGFGRYHGYTFFVGRDWDRARPAEPLVAMGRFAHEAAVAAPDGIVYETEDAGTTSGFYRFLPNDPADLARGGTLQMLAVGGRANYDTRAAQVVGAPIPVEWVTIDRPEALAPGDSCFSQGFAKGGARFARLEGIHRGAGGCVYFLSTSGGDIGLGQLWQYQPSTGGGELVLRFEAADGVDVESPDNLLVTPGGAFLFCEDDAAPGNNDRHPLAPGLANINRLIGLTRSGTTFEFAVNVLNASEFAGACFSPDGRILFVNVYGGSAPGSGMTCAISGPWERGAL
jgi:secreted PhoX family phosphatase